MGRISGTYVAHAANVVSMLQLTQTDGDHVTGALDEIELRADGRLHSSRSSITGGTFDGGQLTLAVQGLGNLAGSMKWNTIQLQAVGSNGTALSWDFEHSSPERFKAYADELKASAEGVTFTANLLKGAQELRQTVRTADTWISNAERHAQRIPEVENYYRKLEDQMRSLVAREHATSNSVARGQLSVSVSQGDVAGTQADIQVNQTWDLTIGDAGRNLSRTFAGFPANCGASTELKRHGATPQSIATWQTACEQSIAERSKFGAVFQRIMQQRAELKSFQATAESRRRALVAEAKRTQ